MSSLPSSPLPLHHTIAILAAALLLLAPTVDTVAREGARATLQKIELSTAPLTEGEDAPPAEHHITTLLLRFDRTAPTPKPFSIHQPERLVVDLQATMDGVPSLPSLLPEPLQKIAFASDGERIRMVIAMQHPLLYRFHHNGHTLQLSLFRKDKSLAPSLPSAEYGIITISLEGESVADALRKITSQARQNLILNGDITGTTSLYLQQVHWREAFDLLITQHNLRLTEQNGVLVVSAPQDEPEAGLPPPSPAALLESPPPEMRTEIIQLHYAHAAELKRTLESDQKNPLLSMNGVLGVDERTNSLLIQESEEKLQQIRALIEQLDTPSRQVLIESRIVIAANDFSHELGARLGITHLENTQQSWGFSLSGSSEAADSALSGITPTTSGSNSRLAVNLPVASPTGRIGLTLAKLATGTLIDLELSAAQADGKTEIIANPRIITSDGYEAVIQQGVQIPYRSDTLSGGTDINFKDAVMELRVTPRITPGQRIILTLQVKKDAVGAILCGGCEPSVDTREVKTQVMMEDGETLVIGGIYEERKARSENRVPLLADLPIIGNLFRSQSAADGKGELLIFITPSILPQNNDMRKKVESQP